MEKGIMGESMPSVVSGKTIVRIARPGSLPPEPKSPAYLGSLSPLLAEHGTSALILNPLLTGSTQAASAVQGGEAGSDSPGSPTESSSSPPTGWVP